MWQQEVTGRRLRCKSYKPQKDPAARCAFYAEKSRYPDGARRGPQSPTREAVTTTAHPTHTGRND